MPSIFDFRRPIPPFRVISDIPAIQEHYIESRRNGTSHRMAEMFALRQSPALQTDTRWIAGHDPTLSEKMPDLTRNRLLSQARQAGVSTDRAVYKSGLARFPGDPQAWVESRDDCKRLARQLGRKLEGGINYTPPGYDDIPVGPTNFENYRVADDIVEEHYEALCEREPEAKHNPDAKEALAAKLSGHE